MPQSGEAENRTGDTEVTIASYDHRARHMPGVEFWGVLLLVAALVVWSLDAYAFATVL